MKEEKTCKTEAVDIRKNSVEILEKFGFSASLCFFSYFYSLNFDQRTADLTLGVYSLNIQTYFLEDRTVHPTTYSCHFSFFPAKGSQKHSTQSYVFQTCGTLQTRVLFHCQGFETIHQFQSWTEMSEILNWDLLFRLMITTYWRKLGKSDQSLSEFNYFYVCWTLTVKGGFFYCRFFLCWHYDLW